jgi:hypothetical protein
MVAGVASAGWSIKVSACVAGEGQGRAMTIQESSAQDSGGIQAYNPVLDLPR